MKLRRLSSRITVLIAVCLCGAAAAASSQTTLPAGGVPEIVVYLKPDRATTVLQGGTGNWSFAPNQQPAQKKDSAGIEIEFHLDPAMPASLYVRRVRRGALQERLTSDIGRFELFDDGLSLYAEWIPKIDQIDADAIGPVRLIDGTSRRRVTLRIDKGPPPESIVFVLDASGSMKGDNITRAKAALLAALAELQEGAEFAVWVFFDCTDITLLYPFGNSRSEVETLLQGVGGRRATPLGDAMAMAFDYLHKNAVYPPEQRRLVVLSDGRATCGRMPLDVVNGWSDELKASQQMVVVGFEVKGTQSLELEAIAKAAGGTYMKTDKSNVSRTLKNAMKRKAVRP